MFRLLCYILTLHHAAIAFTPAFVGYQASPIAANRRIQSDNTERISFTNSGRMKSFQIVGRFNKATQLEASASGEESVKQGLKLLIW